LSNPSYPIHQMLFKEKKYIIENIANGNLLPPRGAYVLALPLKVQNGGEGPARVIALVPKK
jgi:kynurenine formamidase